MSQTTDETPTPTIAPTVDTPATEQPAAETPEKLTPQQEAELAALTGEPAPTPTEENPESVQTSVEPPAEVVAEEPTEEIPENVPTSEDEPAVEPEVLDEPDDETPPSAPAAPETPSPTPAPTQPPKKETPADPPVDESATRTARLREINAEVAKLKQKATGEDFDPFVDGKQLALLQIEKDELRDAELEQIRATTRRAEQRDAEDAHWNRVDAANPELRKGQARQLWDEFYAAALKSEPTADGAYSLARYQLNERVSLIKKQKAAAKKTPAPTPTPAPTRTAPPAAPKKAPPTTPGQVIPTGAGVPHRPPQPKPKTQDELIEEFARKAGDPHDFFTR